MPSSSLKLRQEKIELLEKEEFDVVIIGAGITGAGIAWDAALRGLKVAIIDKGDYGEGTSSCSSKLVHAGIRYLSNCEFSLVKLASQERMLMFKMCPHQTAPIPFLIPVYKKGKNTTLRMLAAGVLYDTLSSFKNTENFNFLSKEKTLEKVPHIKTDDLKHSLYYWDGIMDDARVTLETILSAQENGALCINYVKADSFILEKFEQDEIVKGVNVTDIISGKSFSIKGKVIINSTGPWTDEVLSTLGIESKFLRTTKGIHIVTKRIVRNNLVVVVTADDGRSLFVIPFRSKYSLIGTTDTDYTESNDYVAVTNEDIEYVISAVNNDFPGALTKDDVISAYSGVRPLLLDPTAKSEDKTSRGFEIIESKFNLLTVTGGKYTIFRHMAEKTVDKILKIMHLKKRDYPCKTKKTQLYGAIGIKNMIDYLRTNVSLIIKKFGFDFEVADHIVHTYGTNHQKILTLIEKDKKLKERIVKDRPHILVEIVYSIENEMCLSLSDFMLRRTQLQLLEHQGLDCAERIAEEMGNILGWDKNQKKQQFDNYVKDLTWNP
ncbi:MAG: glycerol-3-phosphate dehydrogenase/oxidase [Candidatus Heimdallarchaeota archaeon]